MILTSAGMAGVHMMCRHSWETLAPEFVKTLSINGKDGLNFSFADIRTLVTFQTPRSKRPIKYSFHSGESSIWVICMRRSTMFGAIDYAMISLSTIPGYCTNGLIIIGSKNNHAMSFEPA